MELRQQISKLWGLIPAAVPLLSKELREQSAHKRTWFIRAGYVTCLLWFFVAQASWMWTENVLAMLGNGGRLFDFIIGFQFFGVYILVPLSSFGLITSEKERGSLDLLLITRLSPWTIITGKLLSRLVGAWLFLVSSLPLLGICYSMGGVSPNLLANSIWVLSVSAFQCASVALLCSAWARTSVQAFGRTLVLGVVIASALPIGSAICWELTGRSFSDLLNLGITVETALFGPTILYDNTLRSFPACVLRSLPMIASGLLCLVGARYLLTARTAAEKGVAARRLMTHVERSIDGVIHGAEAAKHRSGDLPADEPIAWMETSKILFSKLRYQVLVLVLAMVAVLGGTVYAASFGDEDVFVGFVHGLLWPLSILAVAGKAGSLFGTERSRQTLDILLTSPMPSKSIVSQKMRGVYRQIGLFLSMFLLVVLLQLAVTDGSNAQPRGLAFLCGIVTPAVYLTMTAWLAASVSIRSKTAARGSTVTTAILVVWSLFPLFGCLPCLVDDIGTEEVFFGFIIPTLTPAFYAVMSVVAFHEDGPIEDVFLFSMIWNTVIYSLITYGLYRFCMENADETFGRVDGSRQPSTPPRAETSIEPEVV